MFPPTTLARPDVIIPESQIDAWIHDDVPYFDLTTHTLGIGELPATIRYAARNVTVACCTEEAARICVRLGLTVGDLVPSGTLVQPGATLLSASGPAGRVHAAWRVSLILLEYASGIATRTFRIVEAARKMNPAVEIATTRKSVPGAKAISIKAVLAGGGSPHRLGLSETLLYFDKHMEFCGGLQGFIERLPDIRRQVPEKKIVAEAQTVDEALLLAAAGVDAVQIDKATPAEIADAVRRIRAVTPHITLLATGGVNATNAAEYAATGVDVLLTSSVYAGPPANIAADLAPL